VLWLLCCGYVRCLAKLCFGLGIPRFPYRARVYKVGATGRSYVDACAHKLGGSTPCYVDTYVLLARSCANKIFIFLRARSGVLSMLTC
jgi:hypothetical protein